MSSIEEATPETLTLTVEEAGEVLRIKRNAAYRAVKAGYIPSIRIGRAIRVPAKALYAMLEATAQKVAVE